VGPGEEGEKKSEERRQGMTIGVRRGRDRMNGAGGIYEGRRGSYNKRGERTQLWKRKMGSRGGVRFFGRSSSFKGGTS